ncbi:hypothetical protein [Niabella drilacis]|uniref:Uncharacterized protein n=1 Tax=Niabella drilacis (strain DSM 25811 / CCM 8410 / CCUG 62505 / LMG 26954 / E90) TaxID=1285928 RepID=A0A1G6KM64_NIADE|nr:hypothetical protein [Niabella drilacis]SDC31625.1 hypothetical protein SAMN04487894_10215 [Niabella drilacis]
MHTRSILNRTKLQLVFTLLSISLICFEACNKKYHPTKETVSKSDAPTQYQGLLLPGSLRVKNDSVFMALYPSAALYYLDLRVKGSNGYYTLLKQAVNTNTPVRTWVFMENKSPVEVAKIEAATKEELEQWKKAWVTPNK